MTLADELRPGDNQFATNPFYDDPKGDLVIKSSDETPARVINLRREALQCSDQLEPASR